MFVTLAIPQCATLFRTVAYLATAVGGATDAATALANTWAKFAGPANVCAWNDETRAYDRKLYYHHIWPDAQSANTTAELLGHTNGNCDGWIHLFHDTLRVNQVEVTEIVVLPHYVAVPATDGRLVIKNVNWDDDTPEFPNDAPWKYGNGDVYRTPAGLPGQNMESPAEKVFAWHYVAKRVVSEEPFVVK